MRILVTGSTGLLGANLVLAAVDRGAEVTALLHRHQADFPGTHTQALDLFSTPALNAAIAAARPDWVVHCAASTNVDWCEDHPREAEQLHVGLTRGVATAAAAAGARLVYVSTDSVFDGQAGNYREDDPTGPVNVYARTKLAGETAAQTALPACLVARINLFGWNLQPKQSLGEWVLGKLEAGERVPGFTDVRFNPLLASDLAGILLDLMARDARGVLHVAGQGAASKYEFARLVAEAFGFDPGLVDRTTMAGATLRAPRPHNTTLDVSQLTRTLGCPPPGLAESVRRFRAARDQGAVARLKSCLRSSHA
jgi:dTDP-4-dehydrorhamnose reductase